MTSLLLVTSCLDFLHLPLLGGESPCSSPGGGGVRTWAPPDDEAWRENRRRTAAMCFLLSCEEIRSDPSAEEGSTSGWAGRGTGGRWSGVVEGFLRWTVGDGAAVFKVAQQVVAEVEQV